jgi:hypothetical protein
VGLRRHGATPAPSQNLDSNERQSPVGDDERIGSAVDRPEGPGGAGKKLDCLD